MCIHFRRSELKGTIKSEFLSLSPGRIETCCVDTFQTISIIFYRIFTESFGFGQSKSLIANTETNILVFAQSQQEIIILGDFLSLRETVFALQQIFKAERANYICFQKNVLRGNEG